jgi:hypothetical protein
MDGRGRRLLGLLLGLLELLFGVVELLFSLVEGVLLDEDGLGQDVGGVGIAAECLVDELLGLGIFVREDGLVDAIGEALEQLLFLRSHDVFPRGNSSA